MYFGSCQTLDVEQGEIDEFRRVTGARVLVGYTKFIYWMESAAFDLLLLQGLTQYKRADALKRHVESTHGTFAKRLGFRIAYGPTRTARSS